MRMDSVKIFKAFTIRTVMCRFVAIVIGFVECQVHYSQK